MRKQGPKCRNGFMELVYIRIMRMGCIGIMRRHIEFRGYITSIKNRIEKKMQATCFL